jgi:hypothetical protein
MDSLHSVLSNIKTETKAQKPHLTVFREFLAHLDRLQRKAPRRAKPAPRRRSGRR